MGAVEINGYTIEPGAYLFGAYLSGAYLSGADLSGANLKGATADERTDWPEGFDPVTAGVIFE